MALMPIVQVPDPVLRQKTKKIKRSTHQLKS